MDTSESVTRLYRQEYSDKYESLYILPWEDKHAANKRILELVLRDVPGDRTWLDLCCGPAWHFRNAGPPTLKKLGVDISASQLRVARQATGNAEFIQADVSEVEFPESSFALVTNFWAAYCYLDDFERIKKLLMKAVSWIEPGGALYMEILPPESLASFNSSDFAKRTHFTVFPRDQDYTRWGYEDDAGTHLMTSPRLEFFVSTLSPYFRQVQCLPGAFMVNLVARGRR